MKKQQLSSATSVVLVAETSNFCLWTDVTENGGGASPELSFFIEEHLCVLWPWMDLREHPWAQETDVWSLLPCWHQQVQRTLKCRLVFFLAFWRCILSCTRSS